LRSAAKAARVRVLEGEKFMPEKQIPNEEAIIDEILRRKGRHEKRIPSEKMKAFKAKLGEEIERTGVLRQEFVDDLLQRLKDGEL
jgi:GTP1/Obg family GTP-binding protein